MMFSTSLFLSLVLSVSYLSHRCLVQGHEGVPLCFLLSVLRFQLPVRQSQHIRRDLMFVSGVQHSGETFASFTKGPAG